MTSILISELSEARVAMFFWGQIAALIHQTWARGAQVNRPAPRSFLLLLCTNNCPNPWWLWLVISASACLLVPWPEDPEVPGWQDSFWFSAVHSVFLAGNITLLGIKTSKPTEHKRFRESKHKISTRTTESDASQTAEFYPPRTHHQTTIIDFEHVLYPEWLG